MVPNLEVGMTSRKAILTNAFHPGTELDDPARANREPLVPQRVGKRDQAGDLVSH